MPDKIIVIKNLDGSVSIIHPAPEMFDPESRTRQLLASKGVTFDSDAEVLEFIKQKDAPKDLECRIADLKSLPKDRFFREAWTDNLPTETVDIDLNKAKEIKKDQFRALRKPLLDSLDIEYQRADERQDLQKKEDIAQRKQALRDITKLPFPADLNELKDFIPDILK